MLLDTSVCLYKVNLSQVPHWLSSNFLFESVLVLCVLVGFRACFVLTLSVSHPYFGIVPSESSWAVRAVKQFEDLVCEDEPASVLDKLEGISRSRTLRVDFSATGGLASL